MARTKHGSPTLDVQITPEQHERAVKSKSGACLIADAIKEQYPHLTGVTVDMATVRVSDRKAGVRYTYLTPPLAQHLLLSFDQGWPQPTDRVVIKRAVKVTPIVRSKKSATTRQERFAELEAKEVAGELTVPEKRALARLRTTPDRPTTYGPSDVKVDDRRGTVVHGGPGIPQGQPHPNLLRGTDRHFGAKLADPGAAFQEAVDAGVAEQLAKERAETTS